MKNIPQLDLHGKTEEEIFDLLDCFIRENSTKEEVLVIVGKGKGIIKNKVLEYLKLIGYSWTYEKVRGVENQGALMIDLS